MNEKETILAWIALLAVLASGFISIRNDVRTITIQVTKVTAQVDSLHEVCCSEINKGDIHVHKTELE